MTVTITHTWYCNAGNMSTTGYYAVAQWTLSTAYTVGQLVRQRTTPAVGSERVFICIVAGTTSATEPTWVVTRGAKNSGDGTVTWMEATGLPALNADVTNTPTSAQNRSGAQVLGYLITDTGSNYFICTTAGTTGASSPTWNTTVGVTTVDSACTWTCIGPVSNFSTQWAAPHVRLTSVFAVNGDTFYISSAHAETQASALTMSIGGFYYCVSNILSAVPPASADFTTGAQVSVTGNFGLTIGSGANIYFLITGISFITGASGAGVGSTINVGSSSACYVGLRNCKLTMTATNSGSSLSIGNTGTTVEMYNTTLAVPSLGFIRFLSSIMWRDTPSACVGCASTTYIGSSGAVLIEGVDLSALSNTGIINLTFVTQGRLVLSGCKLPAIPTTFGSGTQAVPAVVDVVNCDSGSSLYRHERWNVFAGSHVVDTSTVRTGGASDGTTAIAWKITNPAAITWMMPFECMPITIWWTSALGPTGSVVLQGLINSADLPYNDQVWFDTRYYGTASSTLLTCQTGTKATVASSHTQYGASTAAWDSLASARINSNAYSIGNLFLLSSNPGQLFVCTTAGSSASSQPSAYQPSGVAVADGVFVTDGTAVFRALVRFQMSMTLSPLPQSSGYLRCYVKTAIPSSSFWIDPLVVLS